MGDYSNPSDLMLRKSGASKKPSKQKLSSRKRHYRSAKHSKLHTYSEKQLPEKIKENAYSSDESCQGPPIEERVLEKLKRERRFLKKWTVELNQAKNEIANTNADESSSVDSKIAEIEKRYRILLPAIKLAMETMEQATFSGSSLKGASSNNHRLQGDASRKTEESLHENVTAQGLIERKRSRWLKESKERILESAKGSNQCIAEKTRSSADSRHSLLTEISKQQLARRARDQNIDSQKTPNHIKAKGSDDFKDPGHQSAREHCQTLEKISANNVEEPVSQSYKPGADGEVTRKMNVSNHIKKAVHRKDNQKKVVIKRVTNEEVSKGNRLGQSKMRVRDETKTTPGQAVESIKNKPLSSRNFGGVEQNVLCTGPNVRQAYSTPSLSSAVPSDLAENDMRSQTSLKPTSNAQSIKSSMEQTKCKCKDKKDSKPCICECNCEEETSESKMSEEPVFSSAPSSGEEERFLQRKPSLEPKNQESMQVQTSFPSSVGPCKPETCPKRRKRFVENRDIEVQTEDTDIEWQYEPRVTVAKKNVVSAFKIPPKRTATMDDRLLRRITFFDNHQSSVCNKNVQFCTYSVHQTKKGFPKNAGKVTCPDCPGPRKCNLVLSQHPYHLTCNEVVVEVKSLELNQEGLDSLMKVCSFLYVDYVFLGHVGNETSLAPVSSNILFDSRKSYCISLRFNKKERSILREQVNPSGLLVKDSIMFIVVCQAAPEFEINKNWDFGFGYLSMKQIGEQMGSEDKFSTNVEIQKIGGTKSNVGRLLVSLEGLKTVKSIMDEELHCIEPQVDAVMKKLKLNKKELIAAANNQTTCKRRKSKK